jgi:hypothetical protein
MTDAGLPAGLERFIGPDGVELLGVRSAVLEPGETITAQRIHTVGILYRASVAGGSLHDEVDGSTDLARWIGPDDLASLPLARLADWAVALVRGA